MNEIFLRNCWGVILQKDAKLLAGLYLPLIDIDRYLNYFNLSPLQGLSGKMNIVADIYCVKPSFKNVTDDIILSLRNHIYTQTDLDSVATWAEKLMRFCEVRYATLKKRSIRKWKKKTVAQLRLLHLTTFFLDYAVYSKDIRLLNTALKISDLKWVLNRKTIENILYKNNKDIISALFQFRIVLMIEYAMNRLYQGKTI